MLVVYYGAAIADENAVLSGLVMDVSDKPISGAKIYAYDDSNIRRPADYISSPTDKNGAFKITLPQGTYWIVARLRQNEQEYGPLLPGDKHSGSPLKVEMMPGEQLEKDFIIADLKETSQLNVKFDTAFIKVEGVLRTKDGEPIENAYAFANKQAAAKKIPDYVGAWTEQDGKFTLFLPEGTYYFGVARVFPPGLETVPAQKVSIDSDTKKTYSIIE